jgi:hypothetical protein
MEVPKDSSGEVEDQELGSPHLSFDLSRTDDLREEVEEKMENS